MPDLQAALSDAMGAQWLAIGAGLITAPEKTLRIAGLDLRGPVAGTVSRVLGLRDIALGAALLGIEEPATRRRALRAVGVMCAGELGLMAWLGRGRSGGAAVRLGAASAVTGAHAFFASTSEARTSSRGVPLLVAGYLLSVAPTLRLLPVLRNRERRAFAAFEAGCLLLSLGWLRRGNPRGAAINGGAGAVTALLWLLGSRGTRLPAVVRPAISGR